MTNPEDVSSKALARIALESVLAMAEKSGKADYITIRTMVIALNELDGLLMNKKDYAGKKGAYLENKTKRERLRMLLVPDC